MNVEINLEDGGNTGKTRTSPEEISAPICIYCQELCSLHPRCASCEILLHQLEFPCHCGRSHTLTRNKIDCTSCEDYKLNGIPLYSFLDAFCDGFAAELGY